MELEIAEPDALSEEAAVPEISDDGQETGVDLASEWRGIMGELKRRRQALTAAVYGEARVEGFDGKVLRIVYPEEQSFYVGMAREPAHLEKLGAVLEERLGEKPRLEVRAAGDESATPAAEEPPPTERRVPEPRPALQEPPPETGSPNGSAGQATPDSAPDSEATVEGDEIQNEREVFEMAREHDLFGENERG